MTEFRVALLEEEGMPGRRGRLSDRLVPALRELGVYVMSSDPARGAVRLDVPPPWSLTLLKSGSAAALHVAAAAEGWGVPCLDATGSVRIARDRIATWTALQGAGIPLTPWRAAWLVGGPANLDGGAFDELAGGPVVVKAARGSRGRAIWITGAGDSHVSAARVPAGPYLLMAQIPHAGPDLKVYVAGAWIGGLERCFPAETLEQKRGRRVPVPPETIAVSRRVGDVLGLSLYGCDFVHGPGGWRLVDVNSFPGYKGIEEAPEVIASHVLSVAARLRPSHDAGEPARAQQP